MMGTLSPPRRLASPSLPRNRAAFFWSSILSANVSLDLRPTVHQAMDHEMLTLRTRRPNLISSPPATNAPAIMPDHVEENGRLYHGFNKGKYLFPCDEVNLKCPIILPQAHLQPWEYANAASCRRRRIAWTFTTNSFA